MKTFLIVAAVILALVGVLVIANPVLMVITSSSVPKVKSEVRIAGGELVARLALTDSDAPMYVVSLDAPREAVDRLGMGPPQGFRAEDLADERSDPAWIKDWNLKNVRYAGKLQLVPGVPVEVRFPVRAWQPPPFQLRGQLESGRAFMNSMTFFRVKVDE